MAIREETRQVSAFVRHNAKAYACTQIGKFEKAAQTAR